MHAEFLVASLAVVALAIGGQGVPLHRTNTLQQKAGLLSPLAVGRGAEGAGHRRKRDYAPLHNYIDIVYDKSDFSGEWMREGCNSIFNCEQVSPHHCSDKGRMFECSDNKVDDKCTIQFSIYQQEYEDIDLALYKAAEENSSYYIVYVLLLPTPTSAHLVARRNISSECSGWQVFHLDHYVRDKVDDGLDSLAFRFIILKNNKERLSCEQVSELFVLNATFSQTTSPSVPPGVTGFIPGLAQPTTEEEDEGSGGDSQAAESSHVQDTPNPFSIPEEELIDYIPIINLFYVEKKTSVFPFAFQRRKR